MLSLLSAVLTPAPGNALECASSRFGEAGFTWFAAPCGPESDDAICPLAYLNRLRIRVKLERAPGNVDTDRDS